MGWDSLPAALVSIKCRFEDHWVWWPQMRFKLTILCVSWLWTAGVPRFAFLGFVLAPVVLHLFTIIAVLHFHRLTQMGCLVLVYSTPKTKQLLQTKTLFLF